MSSVVSKRRCGIGLSDPAHFSLMKTQEPLLQHRDVSQNLMGNLHMGAFDQGMKLKNVLMNNTWLSREKPGGSASIAAAKSHLSDTESSSNKCLSPLGEKTAVSKRGNPGEITQGKGKVVHDMLLVLNKYLFLLCFRIKLFLGQAISVQELHTKIKSKKCDEQKWSSFIFSNVLIKLRSLPVWIYIGIICWCYICTSEL